MSSPKNRIAHIVHAGRAVCLLLVAFPLWASPPVDPSVAAPLTTDQVVEKMVAMNERRAEALRSYTSIRVYHVENGKRRRRADLVVKMTYHWPDQKEFTILSEGGSRFLRKHVLKRLVQAEVESMSAENRQRKEMDPSNYEFELVGYERRPLGEFYVLQVVPRMKNKFLFRGMIWVDAQDFGIVRMEGEPAKNPSWWVTKVHIQHSYQKIDGFWLPARNETISHVRIFGQSLLTIEYKEYALTEVHRLELDARAQASATAELRESR